MSDRQQTAPYPLRMPEDLRTKLKEASAENHRSLNAEIVARLQESFDDRMLYGHKLSSEMTPEEIANLNERVSRVEQALGDFLGRNERPDEAKDRDTEPS